MKKYVIFLVLLIATLCVKAQSIIPQVNENVELMSILSRMAGFPEYHMDMAGQYIKDMDSYFKESTDHPAVQYMKGLRNKYGIAYDAVMSMAVHLDNRNGVFSLIEEEVSTLAYIIHSGFISGYQNRYGDNLKPPTNVYHRMTA